jgi:hypothetical protein
MQESHQTTEITQQIDNYFQKYPNINPHLPHLQIQNHCPPPQTLQKSPQKSNSKLEKYWKSEKFKKNQKFGNEHKNFHLELASMDRNKDIALIWDSFQQKYILANLTKTRFIDHDQLTKVQNGLNKLKKVKIRKEKKSKLYWIFLLAILLTIFVIFLAIFVRRNYAILVWLGLLVVLVPIMVWALLAILNFEKKIDENLVLRRREIRRFLDGVNRQVKHFGYFFEVSKFGSYVCIRKIWEVGVPEFYKGKNYKGKNYKGKFFGRKNFSSFGDELRGRQEDVVSAEKRLVTRGDSMNLDKGEKNIREKKIQGEKFQREKIQGKIVGKNFGRRIDFVGKLDLDSSVRMMNYEMDDGELSFGGDMALGLRRLG